MKKGAKLIFADGKKKIKNIPYGMSDYEFIRRENYYYVDKTPYLKSLNHQRSGKR